MSFKRLSQNKTRLIYYLWVQKITALPVIAMFYVILFESMHLFIDTPLVKITNYWSYYELMG